MEDATLLEARRRAEQAVSDMAEGPLKLKAFEVILNNLIQDCREQRPASVPATRAPKPEATPESAFLSPDSGVSPSEKQLMQEKKPANHSETVAILAFCLRENGVEEFSEDDLKKSYLRAGVRPPKVVSQAIRDAKNKFEYIEAGSERGLYRLSHHGDRTVRFDLPRQA